MDEGALWSAHPVYSLQYLTREALESFISERKCARMTPSIRPLSKKTLRAFEIGQSPYFLQKTNALCVRKVFLTNMCSFVPF